MKLSQLLALVGSAVVEKMDKLFLLRFVGEDEVFVILDDDEGPFDNPLALCDVLMLKVVNGKVMRVVATDASLAKALFGLQFPEDKTDDWRSHGQMGDKVFVLEGGQVFEINLEFLDDTSLIVNSAGVVTGGGFLQDGTFDPRKPVLVGEYTVEPSVTAPLPVVEPAPVPRAEDQDDTQPPAAGSPEPGLPEEPSAATRPNQP